jgi:hypothetical protein
MISPRPGRLARRRWPDLDASVRRANAKDGDWTLAPHYVAWVAENLILGVESTSLVDELCRADVPRAIAMREVLAVSRSPILLGASRATILARRAELVVRMRSEIARGSVRTEVERREPMPTEEFFDRYWDEARPVVLSQIAARWPAIERWTPAALRDRVGEVEVDYCEGRGNDDAPDRNFRRLFAKTTLGALCDRILRTDPTNDFYLIARNYAFARSALSVLLDDLDLPADYLDTARARAHASLWLGPAGTVTALHHDKNGILFFQIHGRKEVTLASPFELGLLRDTNGVYSRHPTPDASSDPALVGVRFLRAVLHPGDAIFLPVGWWHHVRALDASVSVSFTSFRRPNDFPWYSPGGVAV